VTVPADDAKQYLCRWAKGSGAAFPLPGVAEPVFADCAGPNPGFSNWTVDDGYWMFQVGWAGLGWAGLGWTGLGCCWLLGCQDAAVAGTTASCYGWAPGVPASPVPAPGPRTTRCLRCRRRHCPCPPPALGR
jgi:hypothetical protein